MAIFLLGSLALQIPISRLSDKDDRRGVLIGVTVASAVACAAMTILSTLGTWPILATSFAIGGLSAVVYPIAMAHANEHENPGAMCLDYGRTVARLRRRRQHQSVLRRARDEMGGTRRVVPILCRDLRVACGIYLLSADAPRPGTRDYRLRGTAAPRS